jgi:hypothetical protein
MTHSLCSCPRRAAAGMQRIEVRRVVASSAHEWWLPRHTLFASRFLRGRMSGGCKATDSNNGVILSLALILVVKFLGGGGHVERALVSLRIRGGLSRRRTSQHTPAI